MDTNLKENPTSRRAAALMTALPQARQDIEALLAGLNETDLDRPTGHTAWSVREALAHIIDSTEMLIKCLEEAKAGQSEGQLRPAEMAPAMDKAAVSRAKSLDLAGIKLSFEQAADRLLQLWGEYAASNSWEKPMPHPYLGTCSVVMLAGFALLDWFIHPWDIRDALGQNPSPNPAHAALVVSGLINLLPRRLDISQAKQLEKAVHYRYISETTPPSVFEVRVAEGKARIEPGPALEESADLVFKGGPEELVLAMLGRRSPAPFLVQSNPPALAQFKQLWISL